MGNQCCGDTREEGNEIVNKTTEPRKPELAATPVSKFIKKVFCQ